MQSTDGEKWSVQPTLKKLENKPQALSELFSEQTERRMLATVVILPSRLKDSSGMCFHNNIFDPLQSSLTALFA